ncbi:MAG: TonB-dependent receptor domain-containing protein, partial [Caulobacteraceae bacterium]
TNVHLTGYTFGGLITNGALKGQQFGANGVLSPFQNGGATGSTCCQVGGSGAYQDGSLVAGQLSNQFFARLDYDFNSNIHGFVVAGINRKTNTSYPGWNTLANDTFSSTNAFLPAAYRAALATAKQTSFNLSEVLQDAARQEDVVNTNQYYLNAGLEGRFAGDYHWDLTYTHGDSYLDTQVENTINNQNLAAALDAVTNPATGQVVCRASLTMASYANCSPLNVFGPTAASSAGAKYVLGTAYLKTHTGFDAVDGSVHGAPFSTWAGPVGLALSGELRRQTLSATTNAPSTLLADCTGLTFNCSSTNTPTLYQSTFPNLAQVSQEVEEGAIEGEIPLVKDMFLAKSIDLNLAARITNYSTSGSYSSWKAGIVWVVTDEFKLRATDSHDIRAPTLYDLFQPKVVVSGNFTDVLTNTTGFLPSINNGNPNLRAEQGYTFTAGGVYQPHWLPGASLTIDTYHTIIRDAITIVQGQNASIQSACNASSGASPYCSLITRPDAVTDTSAANAATAYYDVPENLAKVWTYGIDMEADYSRRIFDRRFNGRVFLTYQPHIYYEQPGVATVDHGDAGYGSNGLTPSPSTTLSAFFDYQLTPEFNVSLFEHYRNGYHRSGVQNQIWTDPIVPSFASTNITLAYDLGNKLHIKDSSLYFSVTNLFDSNPPLSGYYSGTTSAGQAYEFSDDPVGRAFVFGIRIRG